MSITALMRPKTAMAAAIAGFAALPVTAATVSLPVLGSRLIDLQSQNMTVAASATADRKVLAHLS